MTFSIVLLKKKCSVETSHVSRIFHFFTWTDVFSLSPSRTHLMPASLGEQAIKIKYSSSVWQVTFNVLYILRVEMCEK